VRGDESQVVTPSFALTGTPGTGKSRVGRELSRTRAVLEVADAARLADARQGRTGSWVVDLPKLARWLHKHPSPGQLVLVGHLSHLLPVEGAVVLRCHPIELGHRLSRAKRGTRASRAENVAAEAVDYVLIEARSRLRRVSEVDTTGRRPEQVAREVARLLDSGPCVAGRPVDWLSDPAVTEYLLR
jgi:adenylate kinase